MQVAHDLGTRAACPRAVLIGILDHDVDAAARATGRPRVRPRRAEHHDPVAEPDLRVLDRSVVAPVHGVLLRPERGLEERERCLGVVVAHRREDRGMCHRRAPFLGCRV